MAVEPLGRVLNTMLASASCFGLLGLLPSMLGLDVGVNVFLVEVQATLLTPTFTICFLAPCSSALAALYVLQVVMQPLSAHFLHTSGAFYPVLQGRLRRSLSTIAATTRGMLVLHLIQRPSCLGSMSADEICPVAELDARFDIGARFAFRCSPRCCRRRYDLDVTSVKIFWPALLRRT